MSAELSNFLQALDAVKQDLTCRVCLDLAKNPITLSNCFHIICFEHYEQLHHCPTCNTSLSNCKTFDNKDLNTTVSSTKELIDMFKTCRENKEISTPSLTELSKKNNKEAEPKSVTKTPSKFTISNHSKDTKIRSNTKENIVQSVENLKSTGMSKESNTKLNKTLEKRNNKGETALHVACRLGKFDKVTELLREGANTNTKDNAGWTPLHEVVQNGQLDLVKILLQNNALINVPGQNNETPLHEAIRYGHIDIIKELVKNGADINARNIKGETPLHLAKGELKEALDTASENILYTQTVNVTLISAMHSELDFDDIRVYCVSERQSVLNKLKSLIKNHSNLQSEAKLTKKVTHLIVDTDDNLVCTSTLDVLQGIACGIWILSSQWITNSTDEMLEPFDKYEVTGVGKRTHNGPKLVRYNKYKQLPGLFNGCHFYLHNFNTKYEVSKHIVLNKTILTKLITDAGGKVLRRVPNPESIPDSEKLVPYHAKEDGSLSECSHYIIFKDIFEPKYNMKHLKALPVGWLIECIEKYELCDP